LCLALGTFIGAFHGALIAFMRIPMFLVTLCGMLIWRGLTLVLLAGRTLTGFPKGFLILANGTLPNTIVNDFSGTVIIFLVAIVIGLITWRVLRTLLNRRKGSLIVFICVVAALPFALYKGLPWPLLIAALLAVVTVFMTTRTTFGRRLYATGANSNAARLSGVFTRRVVFSAFVISGFTAALAGLFIAGRLNAATPKAGQSLEFEAITACLIGGVSVNGGIGTVPGALFGALILGLMDNGLSVLGSGGSDAVKAVIMLAAGLYSTLRNRVPKTLQELSSNSAD